MKAALFMPAHTIGRVFSPNALSGLRERLTLVEGNFDKESYTQDLDKLQEVEILFTGWGSPCIDEIVLQSAPRLKLVLHTAGSVRQVTSEAFWGRGIPISSANETNSEPVAKFTFAQIMLSLKGFWETSRSYYAKRDFPAHRKDSPGLRDSTVGLISYGSIARKVAALLESLPIHMLAYDPFVSETEMAKYGVKPATLDTIFSESNVVSCHLPLFKETEGLIDDSYLMRLPEGATFINTARGRVVNQDALLQVMQARPDLTALLDVTYPEPLPRESPLYELPNVILSPHIAGSIGNECRALGEAMIDELDRFKTSQPLIGQISQERASKMT